MKHSFFVGVTCNALPHFYTMSENGSLRVSGDVPARLPRGDNEDTWIGFWSVELERKVYSGSRWRALANGMRVGNRISWPTKGPCA